MTLMASAGICITIRSITHCIVVYAAGKIARKIMMIHAVRDCAIFMTSKHNMIFSINDSNEIFSLLAKGLNLIYGLNDKSTREGDNSYYTLINKDEIEEDYFFYMVNEPKVDYEILSLNISFEEKIKLNFTRMNNFPLICDNCVSKLYKKNIIRPTTLNIDMAFYDCIVNTNQQ